MSKSFFGPRAHMLLLRALRVLAAYALLAASQQCDSDTCHEGILAVPTHTDVHLDQTALLSRGDFSFRVRRPLFTNPGLVVYNNAIYGVSRLLLRNGGKWKTCPDNGMHGSAVPCPPHYSPRIISFVAVFQLDAHLDLVDAVTSLHYDLDIASADRLDEFQLGPEDPRVFAWGDDVYVVYNGPPSGDDWTEAGQRRMKLQRLLPSTTDPVDLVIPNPSLKEKNWAPIAPNDDSDAEFLFARFVDPHEILSCGRDGACRTVAATNHSLYFNYTMYRYNVSAVHLATNAVRLNSGFYGAIFHGRKAHAVTRREYIQLPYIFEAHHPYDIVWVASEPLTLPSPFEDDHFIYASGLTAIDDKLVISYNVGDRTSSFYVSTPQSMFGSSTLI